MRGLRRPRLEKNRPSTAIAYGIRADTSATTCSDPKTDIASAAAIRPPATGPRNRATTSVATAESGDTLAMAAGGQDVEVGEVGEDVERRDDPDAADDRERQVPGRDP